MRILLLIPLCLIVFLSGCGSASPSIATQAPAPVPPPTTAIEAGSCGLNVVAETAPEEAIRATLEAEGQLVVQQDIDALMALWDADGQIADAKNTPDDGGDDQLWTGRDAIRNRYVRVVFPGAPSAVQPADLTFEVDGSQATVTATTQIGSEVSPAGDRWQLRKEGNCWLISKLTYNLEPR